jgi:hypothetical protein
MGECTYISNLLNELTRYLQYTVYLINVINVASPKGRMIAYYFFPLCSHRPWFPETFRTFFYVVLYEPPEPKPEPSDPEPEASEPKCHYTLATAPPRWFVSFRLPTSANFIIFIRLQHRRRRLCLLLMYISCWLLSLDLRTLCVKKFALLKFGNGLSVPKTGTRRFVTKHQ